MCVRAVHMSTDTDARDASPVRQAPYIKVINYLSKQNNWVVTASCETYAYGYIRSQLPYQLQATCSSSSCSGQGYRLDIVINMSSARTDSRVPKEFKQMVKSGTEIVLRARNYTCIDKEVYAQTRQLCAYRNVIVSHPVNLRMSSPAACKTRHSLCNVDLRQALNTLACW